MIPQDKFGRRIYPSVFKVLCEIRDNLTKIGYIEAIRKPNLFYKKTEEGIFFADMRSTNEIPIWDDPCPMVWFNFDKNILLWKSNRIKNEELKKFKENDIPYRFSFYSGSDEIFYSKEIGTDNEKELGGIEYMDICEDEVDGYCKNCGKDLQDDKIICNEECEKALIVKFIKDIKETEKRYQINEQKELELRKNEKENFGNLLFYYTKNNKPNMLTGKVRQRYYRKFCNLNMGIKQKIRYLRQMLIGEGFLGEKKFCESKNCYSFANEIHEKEYNFDKLFEQDNYSFYCTNCHAKLRAKSKD